MRELLEISDLIVDLDPETFEPRPVMRDEVVARLAANRQRRAAAYVGTLPAPGGVLDHEACCAILVRAHIELQRLNEEFLQADRVRRLLVPMLDCLRAAGVAPPLRVVDIGCGIGYVVRALAAHGRLGRDVELTGCDMNLALIAEARSLAASESLSCEFGAGNAFRLSAPAHVYLSNGVLHHMRGAELTKLFENQRPASGFIHYDMQASPLAPLGSWIFHRARMREPLARHDGYVSATRAHRAATLVDAARPATGFTCAAFDHATTFAGVIVRPMAAVIGTRPELWEAFTDRLGPLRARLGATA